ncbi:oxidoreductase NAD-binding domain-containing protein 1 isoform X2 [Procambarus clarkii]|uniref:oxidoreductase NAD-binding domain-containing protein 1 isoform X2 n=1 Tax=Procambarus clarkii TaxID=6728 RepID=UPI001E677FBB|nr:oxidoreductase NAD-binding domain-containing protein 1-like isoform X2 [Procambarus clarkii]
MGLGLRMLLKRVGVLRNVSTRLHSTATPKEETHASPLVGDEGAGKHLKITAQNTRIPLIAPAVVTDIRPLSPTVHGLTLKVDNPNFTFKAGQWVDMFIPGMETVGGFSMYSCPTHLAETRTLQLGIKFSRWPPAYWVHDQCKIGCEVAIRAGGDFYYAPESGDTSYDLLLVGGGVGINPLASMFLHAISLHRIHEENKEEYRPGRILLLYSAKTYEELLYKTLLDTISARTPECEVRYFTTRKPPPESSFVTCQLLTLPSMQPTTVA